MPIPAQQYEARIRMQTGPEDADTLDFSIALNAEDWYEAEAQVKRMFRIAPKHEIRYIRHGTDPDPVGYPRGTIPVSSIQPA